MTDNVEGRSSAARRKSGPRGALAQISDGIASGIAETQHIVDKGGSDLVERVRFNNGTQAVHKILEHSSLADAEYLVSIFGRAIHAPVPAVLRTNPNEVYIQMMPGRPALVALKESQEAAIPYVTSPDGLMLGIVDATTANDDRHFGNWLIDDDDRVYGIDHAEVDTSAGVTGNDGRQLILPGGGCSSSPFAKYWLVEGGRDAENWKDNALNPADVQHLAASAQPLAREFINRGYEAWWQAILGRLEAIEFHAKGEQPWLETQARRKLAPARQVSASRSWTPRERSTPHSPSRRTAR